VNQKNSFFCGCGLRRNPRGRFYPGHNQFRRELMERVPYRGMRKPPKVQIYDNKIPTALSRRRSTGDL
jgi:hypothetical protein